MKNLKKSLLLVFTTMLLTVTFSCKKKNDDTGNGVDLNKKYTVKFVGTVSAGSSIRSAYVIWATSNQDFTSLSGTSWTKEFTLTEKDLRSFVDNPTKNISMGIQATGKDANATGKVEIFVDNVSVKTGLGSGTTLSPSATYIFN